MKKIFLALAAVAALAACSKSEIAYEQPEEIGITPFALNRTKSMVSGTEFPAENFMVWAYYKQLPAGTTIAAWQANTDADKAQQLYINEKEFKPSATKGLWGGVTPYYWPKIGSLLFAGYYPTTVASLVDYKFTATENVMTINGYKPGFVDIKNTGVHQEDLMYFNMTATSSDGSTVGTQNSVTTGSQIDVVFRHALSWIEVVLVKEAETPNDAKITVNYVKFTDILPAGKGAVNNSASDKEIKWTAYGTAADVTVTEKAGHVLAKNNTTPLDKQPLFIPQGMNDLIINYTIASKDESKFTETKTINLSKLGSLTGTMGSNSWQPGKKYTYTITIGTSEILIDPVVAEWDGVKVPIGI